MDRAGTPEEIEASRSGTHGDPRGRRGARAAVVGRYQMLQAALVALQIGPALILLSWLPLSASPRRFSSQAETSATFSHRPP